MGQNYKYLQLYLLRQADVKYNKNNKDFQHNDYNYLIIIILPMIALLTLNSDNDYHNHNVY